MGEGNSGAGDSNGTGGTGGTGGLVLPESVRLTLIALASDVLGRLPVDDVPPALRAIARFTPNKRKRLGAAALAAALDADAGFRALVAAAVTDSSPQLLEAVSTGVETVASDPVDVAIVACLNRPEGWREVVAAAVGRFDTRRDALNSADAGRAEPSALREELQGLRMQARGEAARTRDAVGRAVAGAAAERDDLRRTLRERTRELRAIERDQDAAREAATELRGRLDAQQAVHEADLRRVRTRLAEAERGAEAARRGARTERELDDARLWLLVDTLVQAATGVRRELSLAAPTLSPADVAADGATAGSAVAVGGGRRVAADVTAFDRLLALPNVHVVVDGYNVTKTGYGDLSLADQRARLVGALAALSAQAGAELTAVFDGAARPPVQPAVPRGVRVLFSAPGKIADDLIRRLVAAEPAGRPVVVVTSDQQVVSDTARDGAWSAPSAVLLARLG